MHEIAFVRNLKFLKTNSLYQTTLLLRFGKFLNKVLIWLIGQGSFILKYEFKSISNVISFVSDTPSHFCNWKEKLFLENQISYCASTFLKYRNYTVMNCLIIHYIFSRLLIRTMPQILLYEIIPHLHDISQLPLQYWHIFVLYYRSKWVFLVPISCLNSASTGFRSIPEFVNPQYS